MTQIKTVEEQKKEFGSYVQENVLGMVCECGGGGTDDENEKCTKCNGTGVYNWDVYGLEKWLSIFETAIRQDERENIIRILASTVGAVEIGTIDKKEGFDKLVKKLQAL